MNPPATNQKNVHELITPAPGTLQLSSLRPRGWDRWRALACCGPVPDKPIGATLFYVTQLAVSMFLFGISEQRLSFSHTPR